MNNSRLIGEYSPIHRQIPNLTSEKYLVIVGITVRFTFN
ncbi:hypothetical protein M595_3735 [Lyngbya aestuarii BL J]|uniref:Uncharacterized protein n=1 Tax=Lyngbya aestuarii BL J TaxID=1348334 RepID=U7QEJ0_9CYAN|nr:hypothetical protein M595_3735 [Lyngbya aestuarii BL J]